MNSLTAHIEQIDPKGRRLFGTLYIKKPGGLRLIYQPKGTLELIANGKELIQYDGRTKDSDSVSLSSTPLAFLLKQRVRLQDCANVCKITTDPGGIYIVLTSKEDPEAGEITLIFKKNPFRLARWILMDPQRGRTEVILSQQHINAPVHPKIFTMRKK